MLLHVACYLKNTQYQISVLAGVYKNWALKPSEFLKKGVPVGRKIVFRICAFETNYN